MGGDEGRGGRGVEGVVGLRGELMGGDDSIIAIGSIGGRENQQWAEDMRDKVITKYGGRSIEDAGAP